MPLTIACAQVNPTVGDVRGNAALVRRIRDDAAAQHADLVVFPELVLVGYPPEDLVLRPALVDAARSALSDLQRESASGGPGLVVGLPWKGDNGVYNAVAFVADGHVELRFKHELPNYGVFDEKRVFVAGPLPEPVEFRGVRIGLPICEDIWFPTVSRHLAARGAQLLLVPNGSPFEVDKFHVRIDHTARRATETSLPVAYVNQVGGQDELVFDGGSFVVNADGARARMAPFWRESLMLTTWTAAGSAYQCEEDGGAIEPLAGAEEEGRREPRLADVYQAMMLGLRDYVRKNGFPGVVLGMSGGIDSALTAAVAVDALGPGAVRGVRLPSRFTSAASQDDAEESAKLLTMALDTVAIEKPVAAFEDALAGVFAGRPRDVAEENVQARARGVILMAISNKFGSLLVTTGNKSEMSVGYSTLYGYMFVLL
jgi:NAD+ synthase